MTSQPPSQNSDPLAQWIGRCALRDHGAFVELYQATAAKLFGIVLRILKNEARAEEALQEVYIKIWNAAGSYNASRGRPMTWLINIARNLALDLHRAAMSRHEGECETLDLDLACDADPVNDTETAAELGRLRHCLQTLSTDQQACLLMVYHEGYTPSEVARRRQWPLGTVKTWLRRGLLSLRDCMK